MNIRDFITEAVHFDRFSDGAIFDKDNNHILDIRGWGRLSNMYYGEEEKAVEAQDFISRWVADAINEKLERDAKIMSHVQKPS